MAADMPSRHVRGTADVLQAMKRLCTVTGVPYEYDKVMMAYRLCAPGGSRYISPRLRVGPFLDWLDAFISGWQECEIHDKS